ncbi:unnamed protein product [Spirodela intermedia]|uniref:Uncharacterized protein n=1 Tax=Spirodela intermedia TaxID=51605 RepID=A0A7I8KKV9_SPIIN|nr:unnamed protein product [Spirodela intermedia]
MHAFQCSHELYLAISQESGDLLSHIFGRFFEVPGVYPRSAHPR